MKETPQTGQAVQDAALDDFDIGQGTMVEVLTLENRLTFLGKVESYQNGAVVIRESKGGELPPVVYNKEIRLRFTKGQRSLVVHGKICGSTDLIWKLDRLESKFTKEHRAFFRQRISPNTGAMCARRAGGGSPARAAAPCTVIDVSAGGILIISRELYQVGDRLLITDVRLTQTMDPFSFSCQVRRVGQWVESAARYGCQFESLPPKEQDRLLRAIFIVQREEIRAQKDRDDI